MERRVEAGHLGKLRRLLRNRSDGGQIMRLLQRSQTDQLLQLRLGFGIHQHWPNKLRSAVHHTMAGRDNAVAGYRPAASPPENELDCTVVAEISAGLPHLAIDDIARG